MSNETFKTTDIPHEELAQMWHESEERRVKAEDEVRRLQEDSKHWRAEASKLERMLDDCRRELQRERDNKPPTLT